MSLLKLNNVVYEYKSKYNIVRAVNGISYTFEKGKVYAIVGRSGSGKTTLLSIMAGLDVPTSGEVLYSGTPTTKLDRTKYRKDDISVIYQNYNLLPLLNSMENIMLPIKINGIGKEEAKEKADELFVQMDLEEHCKINYPSMLSGGQQQRVAIARSLSTKPSILFADEPTGNLDVENGNKIIDTLIRLAHEQDYCVIIITHDTSIKEKVDVVLEMKDGKFINDQSVEEVPITFENHEVENINNKFSILGYIKSMKRKTLIASALAFFLIILSSIFVPIAINSYYESISKFSEEQLMTDYEYLCDSIAENWPYYSMSNKEGMDIEKIFKKYENRLKRKPTDRYFFNSINDMLNEITKLDSLGKLRLLSYDDYIKLKKSKSMTTKKAYKLLLDDNIEKGYAYMHSIIKNNKYSNNILSFSDNVSIEVVKKNEIAKIKFKSFDFNENDEELIQDYKEGFERLYETIASYTHIIFDLTDVDGDSSYIWKNYLVSLNSSRVNIYTTYRLFNASTNNLKYYGNVYKSLSEFNFYENIEKEDKLYINSYSENSIKIEPKLYSTESVGNAEKWVIVNDNTSGAANNFVDFCKSSGFATTIGTITGGGYNTDTLTLFSLPNTNILIEYDGCYNLSNSGQQLIYGIEPSVLANDKAGIEELCISKIEEFNEKYGDFLTLRQEAITYRKSVVKNEEIESIDKFTPNYKDEEDVFSLQQIYNFSMPKRANRVTKELAIEDVNAAFDLLKYTYGAYYYFGGDDSYNKAKEEIIKKLELIPNNEFIASQDLGNLIREALRFSIDTNFTIDDKMVSGKGQLFVANGYRIYKENDNYYVDYSNKRMKIISIDGDENLNNYIKKTIDDEGKITYGLTKMLIYYNKFEKLFDGNMLVNDENKELTIEFKWTTAKNDGDFIKSPYRRITYDGLPVYTIGTFNNYYNLYMDEFKQNANKLKEQSVFVLDLRGNTGTDENIIQSWAIGYLGNNFTTNVQVAKKDTKLSKFLTTGDVENVHYGWQKEEADDGVWYRNYNIIFVLVDERVTNAGEAYLRLLRAMDNVIIIGSNTKGGSLVSNSTVKYLPNSGVKMSFGNVLTMYGDESYNELYGFLPDLWVEPIDALDAVKKLCAYYGLMEYANR